MLETLTPRRKKSVGLKRSADYLRGMSATTTSHEGTILRRVFRPEQGDLPAAAAQWLLTVDFAREDHSRMAVLLEKAREGALTADEDAELEDYGDVGRMLELLKAKAKVTLRQSGQPG